MRSRRHRTSARAKVVGLPPVPQVHQTWFSRDLPVLTSINARVETTGSADQAGVVTDTGLDEVQVDRAVRALQDAGYFRTYFEGGANFGVLDLRARAERSVPGRQPSR